MARKRAAEVADPHEEIIEHYRNRLLSPPVVAEAKWSPVLLGPTWQTVAGAWLLPERTLGWDALGWCGRWLQHEPGRPWRFTDEQARFLLWWYALDADGAFLFRDGVLQRLKGWGKDPIGACIGAVELLGPARFAGWEDDGSPLAMDVPDAWVQMAAVSLEQTKNTMRLFPSLFTDEAKAHYGLQVGKEQIHALGDLRLLQAVTSSPATLEGARATFVLLNETQHWNRSNSGLDMADVIERNATKSPDGAARTLRITNAYEPSEGSVAQRDREAWEATAGGLSVDSGLLYDSIEAAPDAPLTAEDAPAVIESIRGDSVWLNTDRIVKSIVDRRNPPSRSRRFWYNQITAAEDAWVTPQDFDACKADDRAVVAGEQVALFFDGSKSDDATALVASCVSDGYVVTLGMWQKPPGERGKLWTVPRSEVDLAVERAFEAFTPVAFYADPSHTRDDVTEERFWDALLDEWHTRYRDRLVVWAKPGRTGHAVLWDMTSSVRLEEFTAAAERCAADIVAKTLTHDGDARLRTHVLNARRSPNRWGVSIWKGHRESPRKIDLAVCMVGARLARRDYLLSGKSAEKKRTGRVW